MASVENGATQRFDNVTPLITPVNNGAPSNARTETIINYSFLETSFNSTDNGTTTTVILNNNVNSLVSNYDNNEYGTTSNGGSQLAVPSNPHVFITYYKMRGFYVVGGVYEVWTVVGSPSLTPPSGHTLINTIIAATWQS